MRPGEGRTGNEPLISFKILQNPNFKMEIKSFRKTKLLGNSFRDFIMTERQISLEPRALARFSVIQLLHTDEGICEVIKHDTAHGIYHIHRFYEGKDDKTEFPEERIDQGLFLRAKSDILENWKEYRDKFVRKWAGDNQTNI